MNNREKKRNLNSEKHNDNGHTSKRLKTEINNQKKYEYKIILDLKRWYDFSLSDPYIIENGNENLLKFLVKHGVDIKSVGYKNGKIPLFDACESGNKDFVEYLIEHGEDINKEEIWSGRTPLFDACKSGNKDLVEYLVQHGADINKENGDGKTPLFKAFEYLVKHGADINKVNKINEIPLFNICQSRNKELVKYLVEKGVDINKEAKWKGETLLFHVCYCGNKDLVEYLIEHGADINKEDKYGRTPLFDACQSGNKDLVEYIVVEHRADINFIVRVVPMPYHLGVDALSDYYRTTRFGDVGYSKPQLHTFFHIRKCIITRDL
ncbi:ankyrin repeat-containing domain protein [Neocallimastix lanati (nom. inval.)]|nr:ankyrin repeat-containing domain protein [Neocallimastix sp. JGI-2020a]